MNRTIALALTLAAAIGYGVPVFADDGETTLTDVVTAIEKINARLDTFEKPKTTAAYEVHGFGGGPRFDARYLIDMPTMNDYLATRGDFAPFDAVLIPFVNSGGGTWRWTMSPVFQMGFNLRGGGFSSLGSKDADEIGAVDDDADGKDDFYSWANYGSSTQEMLVEITLPLAKDKLYVGFGGSVGLTSEAFSIDQNQRNYIETTISALIGTAEWNRLNLDTGAFVSLQFQPSAKARWFKYSLNAGFQYLTPMTDWQPAAGVHKSEVAPPSAFNAMNAWIGLGIDFNY